MGNKDERSANADVVRNAFERDTEAQGNIVESLKAVTFVELSVITIDEYAGIRKIDQELVSTYTS